jgi:uncharacterized protein (TIGR02996 family)
MSSSPLHALVRAAINAPSDPFPRLVLADWLDESGEPANRSWAEYLRARAAISQANVEDKQTIRTLAESYGELIKARLTIQAERFVRFADQYLNLLPYTHWTVRLDTFEPPENIVRRLPVDLLESCRAVPLVRLEDRILFAAEEPRDPRLSTLLDPLLPMASQFLHGTSIPQALARCMAFETVGVIFREYGPAIVRESEQNAQSNPGSESRFASDSPWQGIQRIIGECREQGATGFEIMAAKETEYSIRYILRGRATHRYAVPRADGRELVDAAKRLLWRPHVGYEVLERRTGFGPGVFVRLSRSVEQCTNNSNTPPISVCVSLRPT